MGRVPSLLHSRQASCYGLPDPSWAESFAAGCNAEFANPTKMSAKSLKRKDAKYLTDAEKADLAALEAGEGI